MLTEKAKKQFEEWYSELVWSDKFNNDWYYDMNFMSPSHQWGIYQDWADYMGYEIWVEKAVDEFRYWYNIYEKDGSVHYNEGFKTRQEARNAAIEKLNQLINKQ